MKRAWTGLLAVLSLAVVGCQNKVHDENLALHRENRELRAQLEGVQSEVAARPDPSQLAAVQSQLQARDARIAELEAQLRQPTPGGPPEPGIEGIETSYDAAAGTMTISMPGDVLFASGSATLKDSAKGTLDKIAAALKGDFAGRAVRVEGHTDADKITRTKSLWADNLDLSLNRAAAVTRYLEGKGVPPKQMITSGYGEHRPRGGDKARNRRVEIVVVTR